jgi:hypothetical protein
MTISYIHSICWHTKRAFDECQHIPPRRLTTCQPSPFPSPTGGGGWTGGSWWARWLSAMNTKGVVTRLGEGGGFHPELATESGGQIQRRRLPSEPCPCDAPWWHRNPPGRRAPPTRTDWRGATLGGPPCPHYEGWREQQPGWAGRKRVGGG